MILALLLLLQPPQDLGAAFVEEAAGIWTSAEQSQSEAYDYVVSEVVRIPSDERGKSFLYQQNWVFGEDVGTSREVADRHDKRPYFQVVVVARDLGQGLVHTVTYRLTGEGRGKALAWSKEPSKPFDRAWLADVACMGEVRFVGEGFWEGGAVCPNGYKGGVRVDSRSVRAPGVHVNWDRGYDRNGQLVWGPPDGGYVFKKWSGE